MPCNTVVQISVAMENANVELLKKALESLGYRVTETSYGLSWDYGRGTYLNSVLTVDRQSQVAKIKRAYGGEVLKSQAKRFGWRVDGVDAEAKKLLEV